MELPSPPTERALPAVLRHQRPALEAALGEVLDGEAGLDEARVDQRRLVGQRTARLGHHSLLAERVHQPLVRRDLVGRRHLRASASLVGEVVAERPDDGHCAEIGSQR